MQRTDCVAVIQSRKQNDEESEHLFDSHPDFFYLHLDSSLMRLTPNMGGDSGDGVREELDALFSCSELVVGGPSGHSLCSDDFSSFECRCIFLQKHVVKGREALSGQSHYKKGKTSNLDFHGHCC